MSVKIKNIDYSIEGKQIVLVELKNNNQTCVEIFNYGTIIHKFLVNDKNGTAQDIVLGFDNFSQYVSEEYLSNYPYFGAIIGRYANRIKDAQFCLGNQIFDLPKNKQNDCLHGGINGFDKKVWEVVETQTEPYPKVVFKYLSKDGEEGFPGNLQVRLSFELTDLNELILDYEAVTDSATPINLTHHSYFNLAREVDTILKHQHHIAADYILVQDQNYVATGDLKSVENTIYDFRETKMIGADFEDNEGYDQSYVLNKTTKALTLATQTTCIDSGLGLEIYTTEPLIHFYTAKYLQVEHGKKGRNYQPFDAFCVETQHHPNALNIDNFPNTILQPKEKYHQKTIYKVFNF